MHLRHAGNNVPVELLRTLVTLVDLRSHTRTASALKLTQPAVTAQMKRLGAILALDIFDPACPGHVLSARGAEIVRYARRVLDVNDQMLRFARGAQGPGTIRVGASPAFITTLLAERALITDAHISMTSEASDELLAALKRGQLDIAICITGNAAEAFRQWQEALSWIAPAGSEPDPSDTVNLVCRPNRTLGRLAYRTLEQAAIPFRTAFVADTIGAEMAAVATGVGTALVPQRMVNPDTGIAVTTALPKPQASGAIFVRESLDLRPAEPVINALLNVLDVQTDM